MNVSEMQRLHRRLLILIRIEREREQHQLCGDFFRGHLMTTASFRKKGGDNRSQRPWSITSSCFQALRRRGINETWHSLRLDCCYRLGKQSTAGRMW